MISTVTTTTVSTVTTVALAASLGLVTVLTLFALLIQKELVSAVSTEKAKALSRTLNIAVIPLLIGFVLIVVTKIVEVLR